MKKFLILAAAAIAALSACTKENIGVPSANQSLIFTASIDEDAVTKSILSNGRRANWEVSDEVIINDVIYTVAPNAEYANVAELTKKNDSDADPTGIYKAYYPVSSIKYHYVVELGSQEERLEGQATIPAVQQFVDGKLDNIPMYAEGTTTSLAFKNICGMLAISGITTTDLKAIRVISKTETDKLSGAFTVDKANNYAITMSKPSSNQATLSMGNGVDANGKTFYIALPPAVYGQLQIVVESGDNTIAHMTTKAGVTIERSKMYPITFDAEKHNGQDTVLPIVATVYGNYATYAEANNTTDTHSPSTVECVTLWSGSPIFAKTNIGSVYSSYSLGQAVSLDKYAGSLFWWGQRYATLNKNTQNVDLQGEFDSATDYWGVTWKMPTKSDFDNLLANTSRAFKSNKNAYAAVFTGKGDFSSSNLILPVAGYSTKSDAEPTHASANGIGSYWVATYDSTTYYLYFNYSGTSCYLSTRDNVKAYRYSIRAILY